MIIKLIAVGKCKHTGWQNVCQDYAKRLEHYDRIKIIEVADTKHHTDTMKAMAIEAEAILAQIAPTDHVVALCVDGLKPDSPSLATMLQRWRNAGKNVALVIGGNAGLHEGVLLRANEKLSLSNLTLCHDGARAILLEQLYRSATLLAGHPYHKQ